METAKLVISDEEIARFIELGLGRGVDSTNISPWLNKSSFQVQSPSSTNIIGTDKGGLLQTYKSNISSIVDLQAELKASILTSNTPVSLSLEGETSRSCYSSRRAVGRKVINRTVSFKAGHVPLMKIPQPSNHIQPTFENYLSEWILKKVADRQGAMPESQEKESVLALHKYLTSASKKEATAVVKDCSNYIQLHGVTHYVTGISLGASEHTILTESQYSLMVKKGFDFSITGTRFSSSKAILKQQLLGKIVDEKVERGSGNEAVVEIQLLPLTSLIQQSSHLQLAMQEALVKYIEANSIRPIGKYIIQCGDQEMYWKVQSTDNDHILTITTDKREAAVLSIIPSDDTDENFDFSIGWQSESLQDIIDSDSRDELEYPKMMRYLEVKTFLFWHYGGPLRMKSELSAKDSRLCLYKQRMDDNAETPTDTIQWLGKKAVVFISSAARKSFIAITRLPTDAEDEYKTKCVSSPRFHDEKNAWMLFRLLLIKECAEEVKEQEEMNDMNISRPKLMQRLRKLESQTTQFALERQSLVDQLAPHKIIEEGLKEAEGVITKVLGELSNPGSSGTTCTPAVLLQRIDTCLETVDNAAANFSQYSDDQTDIGKALATLPSLSHALGEVILQGLAASHSISNEEDREKMVDDCIGVGKESLNFLSILKQEKPKCEDITSAANNLQLSIRALQEKTKNITAQADQELSETSSMLGDLVDEELASTAQAIEAASQRIQEMLDKSREDDTGLQLEVNERLLDSCTDLMKAIQVLFECSKDLQVEIVEEGMGSDSNANEFYKKNSRWSEGLISAAKQVTCGASMLVDIADKVVSGTAKFEELGVASHDIAANTAQLVAASRVKARPGSDKLKALKESSRAVSEATGQVVASAQSGSKLIDEQSIAEVDYSKLSLTQAKRLEMESKVKALQLEKELDMERNRLSRLRKTHYHLAGASEGWERQKQ